MKTLIEVARGDRKAHTLLKNARVCNVFTEEISLASLAIHEGIIIGWDGYDGEEIIDLEGQYLVPGFIDAHIHIESTMMTPCEFAMAVLPHGTTTVIADPHEIANVLGISGIRYMLEESESLPINVFFMLPSCVPSTILETSGAELRAEDLVLFMDEEDVLGLAEVMNYAGVIRGNGGLLKKLNIFQDRIIDGHAPGIRGQALNAYLISGISTEHESTVLNEAKEKLRKGMFIMIREGTTEKNLEALIPLIREETSRRFALVSDDRHPIDLLEEGHLDHILKKAINMGLIPLRALRLVTLNPAEHYRLKGLGAIAPGYRADLVVLKDLKDPSPSLVFKDGRMVVKEGEVLLRCKRASPPDYTITIPWEKISLRIGAEKGDLRVIEVFPDQITTRALRCRPKVCDGSVLPDMERDILKIAVFERHRGTGRVGVGFVRGFGLKSGAIASSVAHDSHNIIAVGKDDGDILTAVKEIASINGGLTAVANGRVLSSLPLPVGGLMSQQPLHEISERFKKLLRIVRELDCPLPDPFMTMSFLSLPVIPEIRITDKGIVDVAKGCIVYPFW